MDDRAARLAYSITLAWVLSLGAIGVVILEKPLEQLFMNDRLTDRR